MAKRLSTKIVEVRNGVNAKLAAEHSHLGHVGRGLQREGWNGGYLQALADVEAFLGGWTDGNGPYADLWKNNKRGLK